MRKDLIHIDPALLEKWNRPVPRYTSYPTAPKFQEMEEEIYLQKLASFDAKTKPLSIYIHIPFCRSMCLFCGCSVILNRKSKRAEDYFFHLLKEIKQVASNFKSKRSVSQLHLGGGTPTSLTEDQFQRLFDHLHEHFSILDSAEISIEIDPRTVIEDQGKKLAFLKKLGFNRVSFGVQDLDPLVQEAVRRRQSEEMTVSTYIRAQELGFNGINIDLIYGLPHQTVERFAKTADRLVELKPDRIAFYSYAKIPWLKEHQKAIPDKTLPSTEEKFKIYVDARARFMNGGYTAIGMDHFSLNNDPLSIAYREKRLTRNFQGYSIAMAEDMLGFGLSSIGFIENSYFQNMKELSPYQATVQKNILPVAKGYVLNEQDIQRRKIILSLMCHFEVEQQGLPEVDLEELFEEGLVIQDGGKIIATPLGRLFIRLVAAKFDSYIQEGRFSKAV